MRVFVCEFVTGGGLIAQDIPASLSREGDMMLAALVNDLTALPNVQVLSTRDPRLPPAGLPARFVSPRDAGDLWPCWRGCMTRADAVWPIAPETGGMLERLSILAQEAGRALLGSRPAAVRVAASKRATAALLARRGIPVVATALASEPLPDSASGWVVKPDDGVGAENTRLFTDARALRGWLADQRRGQRFVVQPYVEGTPASVCALFRDGAAWLLSCNRQYVVIEDGWFRFSGGEVGALEESRPQLAPIVAAVAAALPGLWGYAGIDLVVTPRGPIVLEVNPRLTTSYAALGAALGRNPAALVLALGDGVTPEEITPSGCARVAVAGGRG